MAWSLLVLRQRFAICRLEPDDPLPHNLVGQRFWSATRTADELSIVAPEECVPSGCRADRGWRCVQVLGPLPLIAVGVLADLSAVLASAGVSIFVVSTYDTDYLLMRETDLGSATGALTAHGHTVRWADGMDSPGSGRGRL